jgi:HlyD family secretion protein
VLQHQWELTQQDVSLAAENFAANDKLAMQEVIAPVEHRNEQSKWLAKQLQLPQLEAARIANQVQHHEKQKEITQLDNDILQQQAVFTEALQQWRAALAAWQQQYIVTAPCSGRLVLSGFLQQGAALQQGQMLGSVQPANTGYFVAATLPHHNFGKLKAHQKALLRFSAYPYEEFGSVVGKLSEIKLLPTDSGYLAKIKLPQGLKTDHGRVLAYQQGLQVNVEILTDERRLLERLLDGLRKVTQR